MGLKKFLVFILAIIFLSCMAYSQSRQTGVIEGTVSDTEGNPLPGAEVTINSPNMIGGVKSTITDNQGKFRFVLLPPGVYTVGAKLTGFIPQKHEDIRLSVGETLTVDFVLEIGKLEEEVVVKAEAPLIDVKDSQLSTTTLDATELDNVPYNHEMYIYKVIDLMPGARSVYHGSAVFGGTARSGNSYLMDGIEIAMPVFGRTCSIPDGQVYEEVKTMGLGAPAEYDGFSGVQLSMITKSGGNTFNGMGQVLYQGYNWTEANFSPDEHPLWNKPQEHMYQDARFAIGGPFIKDKFWFYGAVKWLSEGFSTGGGNRYHKDQPKYLAKFTFQLSPSTRISALREFDDWIYDYRYTSVFRPKEASSYEHCHSYIHSLSVFSSFSDNTFAEFRIGRLYDVNHFGTYSDLPGHYDASTGMYSQNFKWWAEWPDWRNEVSAALSHHADNFIKGSHDFKFGAEYEHIGNIEQFAYSGGYYYVDNVLVGGIYHNYAYSYSYDRNPTGDRLSFFAQDSWKISKNLVINPGIRVNYWQGHLKSLNATPFKTSGIAPRIGITWDIFGDHSTAFKAHYGKYYDKLTTSKFSAASRGTNDWIMYEVMPDGSKVEIYREVLSNPATIDPNIKYPSMDQFTLGIERELAKDISLEISFVWKKMKTFINRVNIGAKYDLVSFTYKDENGMEHIGQAYDKKSSSQDQYMMTNPIGGKWDSVIKTPYRKYWGLFFTFKKRFSKNWMLVASYALSMQKSTYISTGEGTEMTNPNQQLRALWNGEPVGYLDHNFKIYGTFILPLGIMISPIFNYATGLRWEASIYAPVKGSPIYNIEKPGSRKLDDIFDFDVRVEKNFAFRGDLRIGFLFDISNAFNLSRAEHRVNIITNSNFGLIDEFNMGRQYKIGFRFYF